MGGMTHWAPPPPPSLLASPPAPRLKRQWRDDDGDEPRYASHGFTSTAAAGSQPPRQRRRLSGDEPVLPTPRPQAPLDAQPDTSQGGPPLGYQQQQQQQAAGVLPDLDLPPAPPAEEEPGGGGAAPSSSDDDTPQHPSRRACTGTPGYRLMLPTPLPPAVGLAAPAWAQQLHSQASADAWALVPYSPSLAAQRPADGQREQRGSVPGSQQGGGIQVGAAWPQIAAAAV